MYTVKRSNIFAAIAIIISIISLLYSIRSDQRTKRYQDYEFAPRLQILDEQITGGSPLIKDRPALSYQAKIQNRGMKSVKLDRIYIDYGDESNPSKRMKYFIDGEIFLSPEQIYEVKKEIMWSDVEGMKKRFNINQCIFFLRIAYLSPDGQIQETTRPLYGFIGNGRISYFYPSRRTSDTISKNEFVKKDK
jgi:hypothetical protein